jgi:glycosyltransferase involved in cell wall biosynthesis
VATIAPRKGQDVLVRALNRIRDLPWTCTCVGSLEREPDFAREVLALTRAAGLEDRIRFAGEMDSSALGTLYDRASLFVLPSHYEGYGMAITEALARGLGVVSTTGGAIPETVPADAGILVPPGDDAALADALAELLAEPGGADRRERMREAALQHAARLGDWDHAALAFGAAVRELVGGDR